MAYAALILLRPWPGMSTIVSRGIDRRAFLPPPTRMSMIESLRLGPLVEGPRSFARLGRGSAPRTGTLLGLVSGKPAPPSDTLPLRSPCWIWALIKKRTSDNATQPTAASPTHLTTRPPPIGPRGAPPRRRRGRPGSRGRRGPPESPPPSARAPPGG